MSDDAEHYGNEVGAVGPHSAGRAGLSGSPREVAGGIRTDAARRVLLVDDEPDLVRAVHLFLEDQGYLVFTAGNGGDALALLRTRLPDVVVLDVRMPGMDGFEVLERIREMSNVPVIMLTVQHEEHEKV